MWKIGKGGFDKGGKQIIIISNIICRIGEGNGNPLQYSRLENPGDRGKIKFFRSGKSLALIEKVIGS